MSRQPSLLHRLYVQREIRRLRSLPRYQPTDTALLGKRLRLVDAHTFLGSYYDILGRQVYRFRSTRERPTILDCGANVGIATLYWKQLYSAAKIVAFEPGPGIFDVLTWNCREWQITGVELVNAAVWASSGEMPFWPEGADSGRLLLENQADARSRINVPTVRLRDYLDDPIDLLKLDIEGAETDVLFDCADRLDRIEHLFVEYHSFVGQPQHLDDLLSILRSAGFRVHLQPVVVSPRPFVTRLDFHGMDQAINIFAYRDLTAEFVKTSAMTQIGAL